MPRVIVPVTRELLGAAVRRRVAHELPRTACGSSRRSRSKGSTPAGSTAVEAAVLVALAALAFAVLAGLLLRVWLQGGLVTGADGFLVADPMQYLDWARQAGEHVADRATATTSRPARARSCTRGCCSPGCSTGSGPGRRSPTWSGSRWRSAVLFAGALAARAAPVPERATTGAWRSCSRCSSARRSRRSWLGRAWRRGDKLSIDFVTGELWTGSYLWGYLFTAIAVGLVPLGLLACEQRRAGVLAAADRPALRLAAAVAGGDVRHRAPRRRAAARRGRRARPVRAAARGHGRCRPSTTCCLSLFDASWELAGQVNDLPRWPWWVLVAGLAPLAVPAAFAYRLPAPDFGSVALRVWPLAGLLVYFQPVGTFPFHALQGLTLPLAVLAVLALRAWLGERRLPLTAAVAIVFVLCGIGTVYRVAELADAVHLGRQPFFLTAGERDALRHLAALAEPGGVLAPVYTGIVVPAYSGRETWIGAGSWTPRQPDRTEEAEALFGGRLDAAAAEELVRRSGARFLLSDCHGRADIAEVVAGFTDDAAALRLRDRLEGALRPRFPHVDALRAVAALSIVAYHQAFLLGGFALEGAGRWFAHLNFGVPLFFAISGFLLYRPWVAARLAGEPAPSGRVYAVRRALRIVPAYWVALTLIALLLGRSSVFEWPDAVVYYGFLQGYDAERFTGGIGPAWTLTIEVAFYVLLPFFALAMRRVPGGVRSELAVLGGVVVASLAFKALVLNVVDADAPTYLVLLTALPAQLDTFALGMVLAVLSAADRGRAGAAFWLVALAAFSLSVLWTPGGETARVLAEHSLQSVVAVTLLAPAVFGGMALLGWRPLMWVGLVSYGIYLWHLDAIRELVEAGLPAGVVVVAGTALAIALGAASWYGLERFAQRLGHRRRLSRPPEPAPVAGSAP